MLWIAVDHRVVSDDGDGRVLVQRIGPHGSTRGEAGEPASANRSDRTLVILTKPPRAHPRTPRVAGRRLHVTTGKSEDLRLV